MLVKWVLSDYLTVLWEFTIENSLLLELFSFLCFYVKLCLGWRRISFRNLFVFLLHLKKNLLILVLQGRENVVVKLEIMDKMAIGAVENGDGLVLQGDKNHICTLELEHEHLVD